MLILLLCISVNRTTKSKVKTSSDLRHTSVIDCLNDTSARPELLAAWSTQLQAIDRHLKVKFLIQIELVTCDF